MLFMLSIWELCRFKALLRLLTKLCLVRLECLSFILKLKTKMGFKTEGVADKGC